MRSLAHLLLLFTLFVAYALPCLAEKRAEHVFVFSFDGGKPSVMKISAMPTLFSMVKEGACSWEAQTINPSITLPSHASMLSGVGPAKHHILWNEWEPERGLITVPTIFSLAKEKGLVTAMFVGKEKFKHLALNDSLSQFSIPSYSATSVATVAAEYIRRKKPNLCFIHFADSDGAGHQYGWGSLAQKDSFALEDTALKSVMTAINAAGIAGSSVIILTADHGGHERTHGSLSPEDMIIPFIVWGKEVKSNFKIVLPVTTYDTAATALWLLDVPIPKNFDGKPVKSAFFGN